MTLLIVEDGNLLSGIFLLGEMRKFLAVRYDSLPSPGFPIRVQRKGEQSTPGGCNKATSKEGTFLIRGEIPGV